jgi:uroporphyrinogen decarboxylase
LCRQHLEHFGKKLGIPVSYTENLYEDVTYRISGNEVRIAMGCDIVTTGAAQASGFVREFASDGTWRNEYGMRMKQGTLYVEVVECPLSDAESVADIDAYGFPDPFAPGRFTDAKALVERYRDSHFIVGDIEVTIFTLAQQLVGMEKLMIDMATGEEYVDRLFHRCAEFQTQIGLELIRCGVDAIWVGDDFGSQSGLLFSPALFRDLLKPHYERMIRVFREANPRIVPILHCDGAVKDLLKDIHDIGFEVFNPVQPGVPGHGPHELKEAFGARFAFWGAIDQQDLMPNGTAEMLEADIKEKIRVLGAGGGYMIAPAHIIQPDVSPERIELFLELCRRHGSFGT